MSDKHPTSNTHAKAARARMDEAGAHLRTAADLAGTTVRHATEAAASELKVGREAVGEELSQAGRAGGEAAREVGAAASERLAAARSKGRAFLHSAEDLVRERPLAAFGVAFAAGFLISRIARR